MSGNLLTRAHGNAMNTTIKHSTKIKMRNWREISCSWLVHANMIKMTILPTCIYKFRAIVIRLPKDYLIELEKNLNKIHPKEKMVENLREIIKRWENMWPRGSGLQPPLQSRT